MVRDRAKDGGERNRNNTALYNTTAAGFLAQVRYAAKARGARG
jgi:hypothetical protein